MDKNLHKVKQMLDGEHALQKKKIFGFIPSETLPERKVGDIWQETDSNGNITWVQKKEGYLFKSNRHPDAIDALVKLREELEKFPKCPKEVCTAKNDRLDKKYRFKTEMCAECTCKMEDDLRISGKFKEYEQEKMKNKATSIFKDSDHVLEEIVAPLRRGYFEEVKSDGSIIKTSVDPAIADQIINEYNEYKRDVLNAIES